MNKWDLAIMRNNMMLLTWIGYMAVVTILFMAYSTPLWIVVAHSVISPAIYALILFLVNKEILKKKEE